MARLKYRDHSDHTGAKLAAAAAGALAGIAIGILLAQKLGGLEGIRARLRGKSGRWRRGGRSFDLDTLREFADEAFAGGGATGEYRYDEPSAAAAALEDKVLDAFLGDPTFCARAVDIGATGDAVIELSGWVRSKAERMRATALAKRVPGVVTVVNELLVGDPDTVDREDLGA